MTKYAMYNRLIRSPTKKPYVIFDGKKMLLKNLRIAEIVKVGGKPYSAYFYARLIKGVPLE